MDFFASDRPDQNKVDAEATAQADALQVLGPIKAWSFSTLTKFEECPYRVYLNKVEKIPEPSGSAADRGTAIHTLAEDYVQGFVGELPDELSKYTESFKQLRKDYEDLYAICVSFNILHIMDILVNMNLMLRMTFIKKVEQNHLN